MKYHLKATLSNGTEYSCTKAICGFRTNSRNSIGFYFDEFGFVEKIKTDKDKCCPGCVALVEAK